MKIYIQEHSFHAGKWIYSGYAHAWAYLDYEVVFINDLAEVDESSEYKLFICDSKVNLLNINILKNSVKTYLYVQPNNYVKHWANHPNFICSLSDEVINKINKLENVIKWTFCNSNQFHTKWIDVKYFPLAFDDINYKHVIPNAFEYDICFIGGIADNGFNEKAKILQETLNFFLNSKLKCAFFVNQNINHEQENYILSNSKIALNIHDLYQRELGMDTNERGFKSLGCCGILISDKVKAFEELFPETLSNNDLNIQLTKAKEICSLRNEDLIKIKTKNQNNILSKHTYLKRVNDFMSF